jgi:large subunit ribosomal protein L17
MFDNMVTSLFVHERISTTIEKAKELRRIAEKLITLGKRNDLAARRLAAKRLKTTGKKTLQGVRHVNLALTKLFDELGPRFNDRPGGYTRIIKTGFRQGDNAKMALIELLPADKKKPAKKSKKKAEEKTAETG